MSLPPPLPEIQERLVPRKSEHFRWFRGMVRRRLSPGLLLILGAYWCYGIIEGYGVDESELLDETSEEVVLQAWDRSLRANDALEDAPHWQQWLLDYDASGENLQLAVDSLSQLDDKNLLEDSGELALAISQRELGEVFSTELGSGWRSKAFLHKPLTAQQWDRWQADLDDGTVTWWDIQLVKNYAAATKDTRFLDEVEREELRTKRIVLATSTAYLLVWLLALVGLALVPSAWAQWRFFMQRREQDQRVQYPMHWPVSWILLLFFATEISADVATSQLSFLYLIFDDAYWPTVIGDTLWRLIPSLLLMFILFRRPRWMMKRFGLNQKPQWAIILAVFGLLSVLDPLLYMLMNSPTQTDPTLGIDPMENGWRGLGYGLLSACIMAPVMEEFIFRGFLLNPMLRKWGFWIGSLVTTGLFAISHFYDLYGTISVALFGFSAAAIYYVTRSLLNTILLHVIYNFTITVPMWLLFHYQA